MEPAAAAAMFHDAYLEGIALGEGRATLSIRLESGECWSVLIEGLEALRLDDFRQGNIISCFEVIHGREPWQDALERLFEPPHPSAAREYHDRHAALLGAKSAQVRNAEAVLLSILPSYGADLLAFAKNVTYAPFADEGRDG